MNSYSKWEFVFLFNVNLFFMMVIEHSQIFKLWMVNIYEDGITWFKFELKICSHNIFLFLSD